jgi:tubulin--tyrosine ligase
VEEECHHGQTWILKPSVTNKGMDIAVVNNWAGVLDALEDADHVREWVLQRYIERPLLVGGHKFHLRVYVLYVGALRVFVYDRILMLIAAHK